MIGKMIRLCFVSLFIIIGGNEVLCRNIRNKPIQYRFMSEEPMVPEAPPLPPVLAHIIQHGSNLFYKPQITFPALAIEAPKESINRDCEENKETSDNVVIEPADPQLNEEIKEEIAIQQDTENIAQYAPEPPRLPVQFTAAENFSGPLIIPPARPIKLPERIPAIFFEESVPIVETEPELTPIEIPSAPTLSPFEIPKFPIFVPIPEEREQEKRKEDCITPIFYPAIAG